MTVLSLQHVDKHFGTVRAVDDVSLDIAENAFFALLGPSGSGKTTLLRMVAGFEDLSGGAILLDGTDIAGLPANKRPVNLMFQSYALFPHMSVAQNIAYGLEMEGLPRKQINARVGDILDVIQLTDLARRKPEQLSGGQRQRVALARALVKRPRILLLDEPLGALDKKLRGQMQLELKRIQAEFGITFVVVTHDQEEALVMADSIAILKDGALVQSGTPREVYEYPANRFAAEFIGVMNFLPVRAADGAFLDRTGARIAATQHGVSGDVTAAIRPERLRLDLREGDNTLKGTIADLAYHGLDLQVHLDSAAADQPVILRLTADAAEGRDLTKGTALTVGWAPRDTRIFEM
ncbi:MAG: ABC transporter ATP-binding protein [Pseudomonadota bacterium]